MPVWCARLVFGTKKAGPFPGPIHINYFIASRANPAAGAHQISYQKLNLRLR